MINLRKMSREELIQLNKDIIAELKDRQGQAAKAYVIGDKVSFMTRQGRMTGVVTRRNSRTVSVSVSGRPWRVSPSLLQKA